MTATRVGSLPALVPEGDRDMPLFAVLDVCHVLTALPPTPTGKAHRKELCRRLMEDTDVR
ncbi:hypothetical protein [Streptomyces bluensis]|uniref:AMP-binding enzyme C-terminal domain-containing protein n=1 Tax=Streptomyces bluensis TaxID=33897 RepID=A0ABW6UCU7_9ACTN